MWPTVRATPEILSVRKGMCLVADGISNTTYAVQYRFELLGNSYTGGSSGCVLGLASGTSTLSRLVGVSRLRAVRSAGGLTEFGTKEKSLPVFYNPANPADSTALIINPLVYRLGGIVAAASLLLLFPVVGFIPLWNLYVILRYVPPGKRGATVAAQMYPFIGKIYRILIPENPFPEPREQIVLRDTTRTVIRETDINLYGRIDYICRFLVGRRHGPVDLILPDNESMARCRSDRWLNWFRKQLEVGLSEGKISPDMLKDLSVELHSREEIKRWGDYSYWR